MTEKQKVINDLKALRSKYREELFKHMKSPSDLTVGQREKLQGRLKLLRDAIYQGENDETFDPDYGRLLIERFKNEKI